MYIFTVNATTIALGVVKKIEVITTQVGKDGLPLLGTRSAKTAKKQIAM
ncbi:hypothetical protein [Pseudoalteromonas denitrificans]|nr:hypothetical protein [Pseudoalteromonas denitrificans]